jgi:putative transposase
LVWRRGVEAFQTEEYGAPRSIVTDGLRAYSAAMNEIGVAAERHEIGGRLNNRAENSHQLFRRQERAMHRFRSARTLQKFSSVHAQVHNQFNQEHHLVTRQVYKQRRSAALAEWRALLRHRSPLARWRSRCKSTSLRYFLTPPSLMHLCSGNRCNLAPALTAAPSAFRRR